jgi:hypothetical protein
VIVVERTSRPGSRRLTVAVRCPEGTRELWYEYEPDVTPPSPETLDFAAIALTPLAMMRGLPLHLDGKVSLELLANLEEFRDVWHRWEPTQFEPVDLGASELVRDRPGERRALWGGKRPTSRERRSIAAFSGGVDAVHTVLMHSRRALGARSAPPVGAVLVHGFDIPLTDEAGFDHAARGAKAILDDLGIPLVRVRSNLRDGFVPHWEFGFMAATASVLRPFDDRADVAIVGSGAVYGQEPHPWGSHSTTDHLLGSPAFPLYVTGLSVTRTEKARVIGELAAVRKHIRVCWEGPTPGSNCGSCEKCVRTKLNFLAAGHDHVEALGPLTVDEVGRIAPRNEAQRNLLADLLCYPETLGRNVVEAIERLLDKAQSQRP